MLNRAKALFSRKTAEPKAEPFALRCTCGRKIEGLRRTDAQTLSCEDCGAAVFVLPVNPLPRPGPAKRSKSARAARSAAIAPTNKPIPDEVLDVDVPTPSDVPRVRTRPAILDRKWREEEPSDEEVLRRSRPWISRRRAIALGIIALMAVAGYGVYRKIVITELADNLPDRARRGLQLVQDGKLDEAYEPLRLAWRAIDWAGAHHPQEDAVRQAYLEVAAVRDLLGLPLEDALEPSATDPASFAARYKGKTVLLDVEVEINPEAGWIIHWAMPIGDNKTIKLHPSGLTLFDDLGVTTSTRVLVAAKLEGIEETEDGMQIRLQPNSGVLVTEFAVLEKMGLAGDSAADAVRRAQRERVIEQ
jgi:hypothetical protein